MKLHDKDLFEDLKRVQRSWSLSTPQMAALVHVSPEVYTDWLVAERAGEFEKAFAPDLEAAGPLISFYRRVVEKFPRKADQIRWLFLENLDFGGAKPIDIAMSSVDNLVWLNYHLSAGASPLRTSPAASPVAQVVLN